MYQVGITNHRPGRTPQDAKTGINAWADTLTQAGIQDFDAQLGIGGWEGGREPTFVTRIPEGELRQILFAAALFAKAAEQDAAFVLHYHADANDPNAEPVHEIDFGSRLTTSQMRSIEKALTAVGFGGWTWSKKEGRTRLQLVFFPQWSEHSRDKHYAKVATISDVLVEAGIDHAITEAWATQYLLSPENYHCFI